MRFGMTCLQYTRQYIRVAVCCLPWRGNFNMPEYRTRFLLLGLQSLEHRWKVAQSVFVAKLLRHEIEALELLKIFPFTHQLELIDMSHRHRCLKNKYSWTLASYNDALLTMFRQFNSYFESLDFHLTAQSFKTRGLESYALGKIRFNNRS